MVTVNPIREQDNPLKQIVRRMIGEMELDAVKGN